MRGTETRSNSRRHFHLEQKPRRKAIQHFQWLGKPFPMRSAMRVCLLNSSSPLTHVHLKSIPYKVLVTQQGLNPQCENYFSDPFLKREKEKDREAEAQLRLCTREEGVPALALSLERGRSAPYRQHQLTSFQTYEAPSGPAAFPSSPPLQMLWVPRGDSPYLIHFTAPALRGGFLHLARFILYFSCSHKCLVSLISRI